MSEEMTVDKVQSLITRGPYHQWLGLKVVAVHDDGIELSATWREEWVVNPDRRYTHGGILAALVDLAADWAMVKKTGRGVPTIDLRVDYHAAAMPGDLTARGKVVRMGGQFSTAEAHVFDKDGKLLVCGATAGYDPKEDLRYVWSFELKIIGSNSFYDEDLKGLMDLIQQGKMKPVIDKVLPLDEAAEGLRLIQDREVFGKVVVTP